MRKESNMSKQELYEEARKLVNSVASHQDPSFEDYCKLHKEADRIRSAFWNLEKEEESKLD